MMLQLYFWPMACSLASRIALMEAGVDACYHAVNIFNKKILENDGDFWSISPKGAVPVLGLEDGQKLTENAAVLQYIADLRPDLGLAPAAGDPDRYRLQEWLSFVGTEIHKAFLFPTFWYANEAAKASARERESASGRTYLSPPRTSRIGRMSSASASPWRTPISLGRCCC
jgi:glutathione S-transferase